MSGIQYIIDEKGNRTAVIIDLEYYKEIWEEFNNYRNNKSMPKKLPISYFSQIFEKRDTDEMAKAIDEHCEKVDNEW